MKTIFLLTVVFLQLSMAGHSQSVTLRVSNTSATQVLYQLSRQSGYDFIYDAKLLRNVPDITVELEHTPLRQALEQCFSNQAFDFIFNEDKTIVIRKRERHSRLPVIQETVTGIVRDSTGKPLEAVSVLVKGLSTGAVTDASGVFRIQAGPADRLVFRAMGFVPQEVPVAEQQHLVVTLKVERTGLNEILVIGYGTARREDFTGSVGSLNLEQSPVAMAPNINVLEALKGSITSLNIGPVNAAGGEPGITIRGQNSINGSNTPLIVLDGVIYMGSLSSINVNDIASVDVLKDATSAAAYGSRSANGVIAITTKRGRTGKPVIQFNSSVGFQNWQNKPEMLRGDAWIKMVNDRNKYAEGSTNWMRPGELANREAGRETIWLDEVSRRGVMQNYQAAVSGATEDINYYLSTAYDDNNSIIVGDRFNRISLMGKVKANVTKWLEVGADAGFAKRDYFGGAASLAAASMMSPYGVMYRDDQGNLEKYPYTESAINPLWGVDDGTRDREEVRHDYRLNAHALVKVPWVNGLTYRVNYLLNQDRAYFGNLFYESYYVQEGDSPLRYDPATIQGFLGNANGSIEHQKAFSYVLDNIVNYNQSFGVHDLDVTLVATRDFHSFEQQVMTGSNFADNGNTALGISGLHKATVQRIDLNGRDRANVGYLARASYSANNRYYVTGSYRRDGASVFGTNNKWANFWAAGVAWRVKNELFLHDFAPLDDLKLKFSWGQNGNQGVGPYGTLSAVATAASGGIRYEFSNTPGRIYYGLSQTSLGNSYLGWETTSSWNTGFESAWLKNRIFVDLDVYFAKTTNQIFTRTIPVMTGFNTMLTSMGQVNNTGVETTLRTVNVRNQSWNWSTTFTFWKNFNKLVSLYGEDLDGDGREDDDISNEMFIGKSLNAIYGYYQDGIVQESDTEYMQLTGATPGSPKYRDLDGQPGITAADRAVLGYRKANFRMNLSSSLSYKNISLYVMAVGIFGGNNFYLAQNTNAYMTSGTGRPADNTHYIPYWTPENPSNEFPSATFAGDGRFLGLQSQAFIRIQDVSLAYTFNPMLLNRMRVGALKVFATAKNPAIFTKWVGGDPEVGSRMRDNGMPVASTYSLGLNLNF